MKIGAFDIEKGAIYIIAEMSANHNGKLQNTISIPMLHGMTTKIQDETVKTLTGILS